MAVAGALVGICLGLLGYQAGIDVQTPLATMGIIGLLTIGPAFSYLLLWWLMRFYKLDDKMMEKIQSDLLARQKNLESNQ
jgi:Na+/melibiose symporter and related transporters